MRKGRPTDRRRKASAGRRLRPFWIPIAIGAAFLLGAAAFVIAWPGFEPTSVDVTGNRLVPRAEILAHAAISERINMWLQNPGAMARRVATIPYVGTVHVYRVPPSTIAIAIRERLPFAVVRSGMQAVVVDRDLRVLQSGGDDSALPLFVLPDPNAAFEPGRFLTAPNAVAIRDDYDAMIAAHVVPVELTFDRFGGLVATVRGGVRILLGDDADLSKKLPLVDPILAQVVRKQRRVAAVDLRAPATPVIVFK
ncbi:MAG: FtsQ-type POTRA domain-containing protein [Candidatus Tumulicola sp.]